MKIQIIIARSGPVNNADKRSDGLDLPQSWPSKTSYSDF